MQDFETDFDPAAAVVQSVQLKLEFTLAMQRALLAKLRAVESALVSGKTFKNIANLLEQIELCVGQRDLEGYKQISRELLAGRLGNINAATLWRHARAAQELHVLSTKHLRSADGMRPEIWWRGEWGNLQAFVQSHDNDAWGAGEGTHSYAPPGSDTAAVQSHDSPALSVPDSARSGETHRRPADHFPEADSSESASGVLPPSHTPDLQRSSVDIATLERSLCNDRALQSAPPKNQNQRFCLKESNCKPIPNWGARGENATVERSDCNAGSLQSAEIPEVQRSSRHFTLALATLEIPERLEEWFDWACTCGKALARDKLEVFAVARSMARRAANMENPPGSFYKVVTNRWWTKINPLTGRPKWTISQDDEEWARCALRELAREEAGLPPPPAKEYEP
ncbi:MAG TPA: hypothetical protein VGH74_15500 [Planctomycetaceae bacterium]|jgi:hypothetical protein